MRGNIRQLDYIELIAKAAMDGKRYAVYLIDDDPTIGADLYNLVKTLAGELFITATYNATSNGLAERVGQELKNLLDKQDHDHNSMFRKHNISPALQFDLAHSARNAKIKKVLSGYSPNMIENLDFEQSLPADEGPVIEPSPPSIIAEKFKFLAYYEAMSDDYHHRTRMLKFEEKLAG